MHTLLSGIDVLLAQPPLWKNKRIALVTNHAATTRQFVPSRVALLQQEFNVVKLFSPEHGLDTTGADGHAMGNMTDTLTGLPVTSLYGDKLAPSKSDLSDIDVVLFDIPDIGSRFYTYLWTMSHVLEACAAFNIPFIIADRPNPLSGNLILAEGPLLDEIHCSSFIGRWSIPVRHNCTLGELARYFNQSRGIHCQLEVIACHHWQRHMYYADWNFSFVPLSPAIPVFESALLYPGLCFLEATNCSEGRGTATPFRIAGAPWLLANETARLFNEMIPALSNNVYARPIVFTPAEGKYAGQTCHGVMLHVTDPVSFLPVAAGWLLIRVIKELHPRNFQWAPYPTHVNPSGEKHLDLLSGILHTETFFDATLQDFIPIVKNYLAPGDWSIRIQPYLIYTQD
ncbi:exo-beta-N-acetylmuramidase NamZ family protein [Chitinophaga qingshengii]|uniref:DUF1343 domain-containing protein n=1 Tax=Chitinophaga qingshengii TaxID=1569794 RepID=A0ABR7TWT7_9BACT|nr:DUF1343 domain-containing protein [Chitinophaga qingshengii]MBC9934913.1 DUF1343 domain-containing protein [Chitinophaga qingshengii]